jgi:uroporphyrinogen decarboxylase
LENTCNLDPGYVKKEFGKKITFMGGIGIDYLLSDQSKDEEIDKAVRDYIQLMAPGGRFIIGPTHSETSIPAAKLRVLISAVKKYGAYPL